MFSPHAASVSPSSTPMRGLKSPARNASTAPSFFGKDFARANAANLSAAAVENSNGMLDMLSVPPTTKTSPRPAAIFS